MDVKSLDDKGSGRGGGWEVGMTANGCLQEQFECHKGSCHDGRSEKPKEPLEPRRLGCQYHEGVGQTKPRDSEHFVGRMVIA